MRFKYVVLVAALVVATLFVLLVSKSWLFHCEGFGCTGLAFLHLLISALIVAIFFLLGILFGPAPRFFSGLFSGGIAALAMLISFGVIFIFNQFQIAQDWKEYEKACAQYPVLCPEKSAP